MALFFYGFATLMIIASIMIITSRNPVYSVLWLIFAFCNGSGLMVLMGAEFIAMMLIIIYVGAVAVLFLFVVMMLDIKFTKATNIFSLHKAFTWLLALLLFVDLVIIVLLSTKMIAPNEKNLFSISPEISNVHAIGNLLYTEFILSFQTCGIILFVAMIASIALTLRSRPGVKRQNVSHQLSRDKQNSLKIAKLNGKTGLDNLDYDS